MITSAQEARNAGPLSPQAETDSRQNQFVSSLGTPEAELWGEVLLRAIEDLKTYMAYRKDPEANPLSAKMVRSIVADGCDPEYWIFANETGADLGKGRFRRHAIPVNDEQHVGAGRRSVGACRCRHTRRPDP